MAAIIASNDLLKYGTARENFAAILRKEVKDAKPVLIELLKSDDAHQYEFALDILKSLGVRIGDIASALNAHPVRLLHTYFWAQQDTLTLDALWRVKAKLGESIAGKTTRLEHLMRDALSCLGFITLDVDKS